MESIRSNGTSLINPPNVDTRLKHFAPFLRGLLHRATVVDGLIIAATIGVMIAINREWLFSWKNWTDTWMYLGYFLHYDTPDFLASNKKIARLPWILLGFVVNKLTSPIVASYVLHAGLLGAGAFAFYRLAGRLFGRQAAILAALTYLTSQTMHGAGGWDYHNTLLPLLYFWSFSSFDMALIKGRRPFAAFAKCGALFALTIHTNLLVLLVAPAPLIHLLFRMRTAKPDGHRLRRMFAGAAGLAAGAASVTLCLGLINLAFGRQFLFFLPLLTRSAALITSPELESAWWRPWSDPWWAGTGDNLQTAFTEAVLALVLLFSIASLARRVAGGAKMPPILVAINLEYIGSIAFAALFQSLGHTVLQPDYMAFPLYLPMFLSLAGLISYALESRSPFAGLEPRSILVALLAIIAAFAFVAQASGQLTIRYDFLPWAPAAWENKVPFILVIVALGGGALLARLRSSIPSHQTRAQVFSFVWLALILGQANANWPHNANRWKAYEAGVSCRERQSIFSAVVDADRLLYSVQRSGRHVVIWYRGKEEAGGSQACRLSPSQLGTPLLAMGYTPELHYWELDEAAEMPARLVAQLSASRDVLVVISSNSGYVSQLLARLQQHERRWHEAESNTVGRFDVKFELHLISGEPLNRRDSS